MKWFISALTLLWFIPTPLLRAEEFTISDLSGGIYSNASVNKIPDNSARRIQNFFTDVEPIAIERNGFEKRDTTQLGDPSAVEGLWEFVDNSGNQWIISFSSRTFYKNLIGVTPASFGPIMTVAQIPACADNLGKFMCVNGTDSAWTFDGTSTAAVAGAPLGRLIVPWRNRFVISNIPNTQSTVRFSADGDETTWTLGGNATDPFSIEIGGANDGSNVTCMWGSYLDNLIIARKRDVWAVAGFDQLDVVTRNVSSEIGCIQNGSMREFDGSLLFLSNRGMEEMRGAVIQHISEPIRDITDLIVTNTSAERSNIQTSLSDWEAGTSSTSGWISGGIVDGSIELTTATAISDFVDTDGTDFGAGTLTNVSTGQVVGSLTLDRNSNNNVVDFLTSNDDFDCHPNAGVTYQQFHVPLSTGFILDRISVRLKTNTGSTTALFKLYSDNGSNDVGTLIGTLGSRGLSNTSYQEFDVNFTNTELTEDTSYWIRVEDAAGTGYPNVSSETGSYDESTYCSGVKSAGRRWNVAFVGFSYDASGNLVSQAFDIGFDTTSWLWTWGTFTAADTTTSSQTITYELQSATSAAGTYSTLQTVTSGGSILESTAPFRQFIRYKASLTTEQRATTPSVESITITNGSRVRPTAVFTSQVFSIGSEITSWSPVSINDATDGNATIAYQFNSTGSADIGDFQETDWEDIVSGGVPTITTNTFAAFRATFTVTATTEIARLNEFVTNWSEGGIIQPLKSWNHNRRYWLSYTTATATSSRNDRILVYQRNRTWTLLKGINASSFATWRDALYFGDSEDNGYVYKFGVGNNDDGSNIQSVIETKSYDLGNFSVQKSFQNLYTNFNGNSTFSGTFDVDYFLDSSNTKIDLGTMNHSSVLPTNYRKIPFPISNRVEGQEIRYRIVKNDQTDRLKLYDLTTIFSLKKRR